MRDNANTIARRFCKGLNIEMNEDEDSKERDAY